MDFRRLQENDAQSLWKLRFEALEHDPASFAESLDELRQATPESYWKDACRGSDDFVLGAFHQSALVGMAGFYREALRQHSHKGWLWGVYVSPEHRGRGIGRTLVREALERAAAIPGLERILLSVTTTQAGARRLYLASGFRPFGIEPRAVKVAGRYFDKEHLGLDLPPAAIK